jgi:hypothetical protein
MDTNNGNACTVASTNYVAFSPQANADFSFDNIRILSDSLSTTSTFAYDGGNALTKSTTGGHTHTAVNNWKFGGKLKGVTTDFPDEKSMQ